MHNEEKRKLTMRNTVPVIGALLLVVASVAYIMVKTMSDKAYNEKWKDYDECGLS